MISVVNGGYKVNSEKMILTVKETAQILGLSRNSVYQGVLTGQIPCLKVGKRILVPRKALEELLASVGSKPKAE